MPLGRSERFSADDDPVHGAGRAVADNRVRFLTNEPVDPGGVRDAILASWSRSRRYEVAADRVELPYIRNPDLDTPLTRAATPVLRSLAEQLDGQPISIVLTDPGGLVLCRLTPDADLERHLDRVRLAPGFSYAEEYVGTNGIGTAIEGGRAMHVFGHEHYAERLEDLACAGVPIAHPVSGKTVGVLDLTCWRKDAGPLLTTLAKATTAQIRQALLADTSAREVELLQEYLRYCHRSNGIVFAVSPDMVMLNDFARAVLDPVEQDAMLRRATDFSGTARETSVLDLPTGKRVRLALNPVAGQGQFIGVIVTARLVEPSAGGSARTSTSGTTTTVGAPAGLDDGGAGRMLLPGLVGAGALWRRACEEVETVLAAGEWLAVEGEPGVGKLALLRAAHARRRPNRRLTVVDATEPGERDRWGDLERALSDASTDVIVAHVDRLPPTSLRRLSAALQAHLAAGAVPGARSAEATASETNSPKVETAVADRTWVAVTTGTGRTEPDLQKLLNMIPRTVEVPPLRHHAEDVARLVPFLLARLGYGGKVSCSPEVVALMSRATWPGNIAQVLATLRIVVKHCRTGVIGPEDLPPEILTVSRRRLSPLESIERDAIVRGLLDAHDNKAEAARALGMSRATIYRKIHEYGIVSTPSSGRPRQQEPSARTGVNPGRRSRRQ